MILIEDVHWAEQPLLDLIERLGRDVRGPLLLLTTARPDFMDLRSAWSGRVDAETILLEPLPAETAGSLVDSLLAGELPPRIRELVVERSEGNPFFVEEILGSLIDTGMLERDGGGMHADDMPPGFEIPDSVQAVLAARIDMLAEPEKAALQAAAVIGRVFWTGPVYELVEGLSPDLQALETRDFIHRRQGSSLEGEIEYVFKHALTREVAYGGLTKARRARLHAAFAEWIERFGEGREEHAPLLAHHYAEAVRPEDVDVAWPGGGPELAALRAKAVSWLQRAGEGSISRYDLDDAIALFGHAIELEAENAAKGTSTAKERPRAGAQVRRRCVHGDDGVGAGTRRGSDGTGGDLRRARLRERRALRHVEAEAFARVDGGVEHEGACGRRARQRRPREDIDQPRVLGSSRCRGMRRACFQACARSLAMSPCVRTRGTHARSRTFRRGDFEGALTWEMRRFDFIQELKTPTSFMTSTSRRSRRQPQWAAGRGAPDGTGLDDHVSTLTPHHRVHGWARGSKSRSSSVTGTQSLRWRIAPKRLSRRTVTRRASEFARRLLLCALANECLRTTRPRTRARRPR